MKMRLGGWNAWESRPIEAFVTSFVESSGYDAAVLVVLLISKVLIKLLFMSCVIATNLWS
jgi:hypothetical protein